MTSQELDALQQKIIDELTPEVIEQYTEIIAQTEGKQFNTYEEKRNCILEKIEISTSKN